MKSATPWVYINDDEIELRQIIIESGNKRNPKKFTVGEAEKRGLVKVESDPFTLSGGVRFSKAIVILKRDVRLCLSTKAL